jgi:hypothetical protein
MSFIGISDITAAFVLIKKKKKRVAQAMQGASN